MDIQTSYDAGRLTIYLIGELDHHEARSAMHRIEELLDEYIPRDCALNLAGLSFMDSSGIAVIINAVRRMKALGGRLTVEKPAPQPRKVLEASGIERLIAVAAGT